MLISRARTASRMGPIAPKWLTNFYEFEPI